MIKFELSSNYICKITPSSVHCINEDDTFTGYFYSGDFNSQMLFLNLESFWKLLHIWDIYIANNINKSLNFGFDTLTAYSQDRYSGLGFGYLFSLNYYVASGATFANARGFLAGQTGDGEAYVSTHRLEIFNNGSGLLFYGLHGRIKFTTTSIPSVATINTATLSANKFTTGAISIFSNTTAIAVYKGRSPNDVYDDANGYWNNKHSWERWSSNDRTFAEFTALPNLSPSGYLVWNLNSTGIANIWKSDNPTSPTMMYIGWSNFIDNVAFATNANAYCTMRFASFSANPDQSQYRPILTVDYTAPILNNKFQMIV